jgi:hypothetical protein
MACIAWNGPMCGLQQAHLGQRALFAPLTGAAWSLHHWRRLSLASRGVAPSSSSWLQIFGCVDLGALGKSMYDKSSADMATHLSLVFCHSRHHDNSFSILIEWWGNPRTDSLMWTTVPWKWCSPSWRFYLGAQWQSHHLVLEVCGGARLVFAKDDELQSVQFTRLLCPIWQPLLSISLCCLPLYGARSSLGMPFLLV